MSEKVKPKSCANCERAFGGGCSVPVVLTDEMGQDSARIFTANSELRCKHWAEASE